VTTTLENSKTKNEGKDSPKANLKQFASSYVLLAFALYLVLDTTLRCLPADVLKFSPLKVSHRSWVYWNMREFLAETKSPDTAIFGSSLMMAAYTAVMLFIWISRKMFASIISPPSLRT
jgi:hypothetical protein